MLIARNEQTLSELVHLWPETRIPFGAQLVCDASEAVVFAQAGRVVGVLGPGRYLLDPANIPFLAAVAGPGQLSTEIYFVSAMPRGLQAGGRATLRDPTSGDAVEVAIMGEVGIRIPDPGRLVMAAASSAGQVGDYVKSTFQNAAMEAVHAALQNAQSMAAISSPAVLAEISGRIAQTLGAQLAPQGVEVLGVKDFAVSQAAAANAPAPGPAPPTPPGEPVYEMLWDCRHCGAKKLLGLTHRHCPNCGAQQNAAGRYFPSEEEKVAVQNHVFYGADRICRYCQSYQSRNSKCCGNCGAPLEEGKDAQRLADQHVGGPPAPMGPAGSAPGAPHGAAPAGPKKSGLPLKIVIGVVGGFLFLMMILALTCKRDALFEVTGHSWKREIDVERYGNVDESSWCDEMPSGASLKRRHSEQRTTEKIADGEECTKRKVDNGDGTYREKKDCKPKYKEKPVMADKCDYTIKKWSKHRTATASGGLGDAPRWPDAKIDRTGTCDGCERPGVQRESYIVEYTEPGKGKSECSFDPAKWASVKNGSKWKAKVGSLTGVLDCSSLTPR